MSEDVSDYPVFRRKVEGFVHPVTGELLEATDENMLRVDRETRDVIGVLYRRLDPIGERLVEMHPELRVPPRRYRTETQEQAVRCPACGHRYKEIRGGSA